MPPSRAAAIGYGGSPTSRSASTGGRRQKDAIAEAAAPSPRRARSAAAAPMVAGAGAGPAVGAGAGVEAVRHLQGEREGPGSGAGDSERKPSTPHVATASWRVRRGSPVTQMAELSTAEASRALSVQEVLGPSNPNLAPTLTLALALP